MVWMSKKLWSVFTDDMDHCYFTGTPYCHRHHIFYGPYRSMSEKYGFVIPIAYYLHENYPDIPLQKFDSYATAKEAFENGTSVAWANDNTEVIAFALQNKGYTVGIPNLGSADSIAPAVTKGNDTLLDWINGEIESLGEENFFHADYEATLKDTYGTDYEDSLVVEGGKTE